MNTCVPSQYRLAHLEIAVPSHDRRRCSSGDQVYRSGSRNHHSRPATSGKNSIRPARGEEGGITLRTSPLSTLARRTSADSPPETEWCCYNRRPLVGGPLTNSAARVCQSQRGQRTPETEASASEGGRGGQSIQPAVAAWALCAFSLRGEAPNQ